MIEKMKKRGFDGVKTMREIRDRVSAEIVGKTRDELDHWLHAHRYTTRFCGVWRADARKIICHRVGSQVGIS